jgi:hypothetical protein
MAYFPKSQITPNLYTNGGEFIYASNNRPYAGYYFKTSTGKYFTGRNQDDRPNEELTILTNQANEIDNTANPNPKSSIALPFEGAFPLNADVPDDYISPNYSETLVIDYLNVKKISLNDLPAAIIPTYNPVLPTQQDYQNGEFRRLFAKKTNEIQYVEISLDTYSKLLAKDSQVLWQLYEPFDLTWQLTGNIEDVARVNFNTVELVSRTKKLPKLGEYLKFDYIKYYNKTVTTNVLVNRVSRTN